jgi:hypothetical protein
VAGELTDGTLVSLPAHGPPAELSPRVVRRGDDDAGNCVRRSVQLLLEQVIRASAYRSAHEIRHP